MLADVFLEMNGGRQQDIGLVAKNNKEEKISLEAGELIFKKNNFPNNKKLSSKDY